MSRQESTVQPDIRKGGKMILRVLQGNYVGELREFPSHVGKNLLKQKFAEIPTDKEIDDWQRAMDEGEAPAEPKVSKERRQRRASTSEKS